LSFTHPPSSLLHTLSLHDALPIFRLPHLLEVSRRSNGLTTLALSHRDAQRSGRLQLAELAGSGCARTLTIFTLERARCRWAPSTHSGEHRAVRPLQRLGLEALRRDLWPPAVRRTAGPDGS